MLRMDGTHLAADHTVELEESRGVCGLTEGQEGDTQHGDSRAGDDYCGDAGQHGLKGEGGGLDQGGAGWSGSG